ncbi:MAG: DUF6608 family protein [Sarcina sp.]
MKNSIKFYGTMLCLIFTVITVFSSILQLVQGRETDTNLHILMRFVISIIAVLFWATFSLIKSKNAILTLSIQYALSMGLIFALLYISGFFVELADSAYKDIFINYSIPFLIISTIYRKLKKRKEQKTA